MNSISLNLKQEKINSIIEVLYGSNNANNMYLISGFGICILLWVLCSILKRYYDNKRKEKQTNAMSIGSYIFMFLTFFSCFYGIYLKNSYESRVVNPKEIYQYIKPMLNE